MAVKNNLFWSAAWAVSIGLQVLIIAGLVSSFFPISPGDFLTQILPFFADMVRPEREMKLYGLLIISTVAALAGVLLWGRGLDISRRVLWGVACQVLQITAAFHIIAHHDPLWARVLLYVGMGVFILAQLWTPLIDAALRLCRRPLIARAAEGVALVLTVLMLYVPDRAAAIARIYMGDQFHHFDQCVVGPAWASLAGSILNVDVISQYGLGMPIIMGRLAQLFGGTYESFFTVFMLLNICYFVLWYVLLRAWLGNVILALAGTWIAVKIQMFNAGAFPFALIYPSATMVRFIWDIGVFLCLWQYLKERNARWLAAAGILTGVAVFYMSSTGLCLAVAFYALLLSEIILPQPGQKYVFTLKDWGRAGAHALLPVITTFVLMGLVQGKYLFDPRFWHNIAEFNNYFLSGFGTIPIYQSLLDGKYWPFWMGLFIPLFYLGTAAVAGALMWEGRAERKDVLALLIAVYGLCLYHYYIARSALTSFYCVGVPFAVLLGYWAQWAMVHMVPRWRVIFAGGVCTAAFIFLWTNPLFAAYPNVFSAWRHYESRGLGVLSLPDGNPYFHHGVVHTARIPGPNSLGEADEHLPTEADFKNIGEAKDFYRREFDFSKDAQMIARLTGPHDKVALLASFDVRFLMQSHRRPFFYHYPVFMSRPLRMRAFAVPAIYTVDQLRHTISQLETEKPPYIFIETIYSPDNLVYGNQGNALVPLFMYVHKNYAPIERGEFLMALKRKDL